MADTTINSSLPSIETLDEVLHWKPFGMCFAVLNMVTARTVCSCALEVVCVIVVVGLVGVIIIIMLLCLILYYYIL